MLAMIEGTDTLKKVVMLGDKVLVRPIEGNSQTRSGLYLPPTVQEKEEITKGYVMKAGPGFPIPAVQEDEPWKDQDHVKYIPLQVKEGDQILYLKRNAFEVELDTEKYQILSQNAILMIVRDEGLFE
ncbi:Co-chaperonin GroES (HSP10) [Pseudarcicella hirudinis]|uniref:Co-chaperonin GroES (HSP10) n=2 Tax=Pseudarcicella hirudinis TaxID=1079859 RepID=A0A1I5RPI0_9BACT|nr:co-chaperone GroES family protein [Pseudarcicella hirudinis]SFP60151.1 Co-chaperonin GroES (HSP10) [Pseudarcicella hirudinis]